MRKNSVLRIILFQLLFSDPRFQWGGKSSSVLRFFPNSAKNSTLYNSTPLTQSPCSAFILHTEMGKKSKVKMGINLHTEMGKISKVKMGIKMGNIYRE